MSVLVLVQMPAKPDRVNDLKAQFGVILRDTRAFDGCEQVNLHESQDDPAALLLVERWNSRAHYEKYSAWRQTEEGTSGIGDMLAGPPTARFYDEVSV